MRKCLVDGVEAIFHQWDNSCDVIVNVKVPMRHLEFRKMLNDYQELSVLPCGVEVEKVQKLKALVEMSDGAVKRVPPESIKFMEGVGE